jgi:hypothetical protein
LSPLYLYAFVDRAPDGPLGTGLAGESLKAVRCGSLLVIAGEQASPPAPGAGSLAAHDATVRRLAEQTEALLPVRFGEWMRDEAALAAALAPRERDIAQALALVRGCVQMTLRVFGDPAPPLEAPERVEEDTGGPGTRYLQGRRRELARSRSLPEIAALAETLRPLLRAERVRRQETGRLLGTAYHLIARGEAGAYLDVLRAAADPSGLLPTGHRIAASGPWPPYAFAPEGLP